MTRRMTLRSAISTLGVVEENRKLKAEVRRLRAALREIDTRCISPGSHPGDDVIAEIIAEALRRGGKR